MKMEASTSLASDSTCGTTSTRETCRSASRACPEARSRNHSRSGITAIYLEQLAYEISPGGARGEPGEKGEKGEGGPPGPDSGHRSHYLAKTSFISSSSGASVGRSTSASMTTLRTVSVLGCVRLPLLRA
jgi:hypothetical protein